MHKEVPVEAAKGVGDTGLRHAVLGAVEVEMLAQLLRASNPDNPGTLQVLDLLERLPSLGEISVRYDATAKTIKGNVFQPYHVDEGQSVFPVSYPSGFGACPLTLAFAPSQWRYLILKAGARTLDDLYLLGVSDIPWRDKSLEVSVTAARQKADELLASNKTPPGGYAPIPERLTLEVPAKELMRRISTWLPPYRREIFERAFGFYAQAETIAGVARSMGLSAQTPLVNIRSVIADVGEAYDWAMDYRVFKANHSVWTEWTRGLAPSAFKLLELLAYCKGCNEGKYKLVEQYMGSDPHAWPLIRHRTPKQRLDHLRVLTDPRSYRDYEREVEIVVRDCASEGIPSPDYLDEFPVTVQRKIDIEEDLNLQNKDFFAWYRKRHGPKQKIPDRGGEGAVKEPRI